MKSRLHNSFIACLLTLSIVFIIGCENDHGLSLDSKRSISTLEDSLNYILGNGISKYYSLGNADDYNQDMISHAVFSFLNNDEFLMTEEEGMMALNRYMTQKDRLNNDSIIKWGEAFLERNRKRPEVIEIDRGLQYEVVKSGPEGGLSPDGNDVVQVRYSQGSASEGITWTQEMSTNPRDTIEMALNRELSGFSQACQFMKVGDKWNVWLPGAIGSEEGRDPAGIGKRYEIIYMEIELLGVIERGLHNIPNTKEFGGYPGGYYRDESKRIIHRP